MLGKLQRAHPTLRDHFAPAYLVGSYMLRAYLFFIHAQNIMQLRMILKGRLKKGQAKYEYYFLGKGKQFYKRPIITTTFR